MPPTIQYQLKNKHGQDARDTRRALTTPRFLCALCALCALCVLCGAISSSKAADAPKAQSMNGGPDDPYRFESLKPPEDSAGLEVGGLAWTADGKLACCTRHGEIWLRADNGT